MNLETRKILQLVLFIALLAGLSVMFGMTSLYGHSERDLKVRLMEQVGNRARLMDSLYARFKDSRKVLDVFHEYQTGLNSSYQTWETVVARRSRDRKLEFFCIRDHAGEKGEPAVRTESGSAIPMRAALEGRTGVLIGPDYRGKQVLAAYAPVTSLGWGVVCKVDQAEIQQPFFRSILWGAIAAILIALISYPVLLRLTQPLLAQSRENEKKLKTMFAIASDGIMHWRMDPQGNPGLFLEANEALLRLVGYSRPDFLRLTLLNILPPVVVEGLPEQFARLKREKNITMEWTLAAKNGRRIPVEAGLGLIEIEEGGAVLCILHDVRDRKLREAQVEAALKAAAENEKKLQEVFDASTDAIFIHEVLPDGRWGQFKEVNEAAVVYTGYSRDELKNMSTPDLVVPGHGTKAAPEIFREVQEKGRVTFESMHRTKDGREVPVEVSSRHFELRGETVILSSVRDIAERRQREAALKEAMEKVAQQNVQLKKLDEMKDDFLSAASHELRTPLTSIKGYLKLLTGGMAGSLNDMQRDFAQTALANSDRLFDLVNDLLDLSRLESGRMTMHLASEPVDLVLRNAFGVVKNLAEQKGIELRVQSPGTTKNAFVDREKMERLLINYISNALKFTPQGGVIEIGTRAGIREGKTGWSWWVKDSGIGIPPEAQARVFDKFYQVENADTRRAGGTGLGLAICMRIAEAHGGTVWVESEKDKGSTFWAFTSDEKPKGVEV